MNQSLANIFTAVVPAVLNAGIVDSLCTIKLPDGNLIDAGQPSGVFVNTADMVNVKVMAAPMSEGRLQATEMRAIEEIQSFAPRHVWLAGYFPQAQGYAEQGAIAVIDGVAYEFLGAETDSQFQTTRISIKDTSI